MEAKLYSNRLGNGQNKPPIPVAEFLSAGHTIEQVEPWLNDFFLQLQRLNFSISILINSIITNIKLTLTNNY